MFSFVCVCVCMCSEGSGNSNKTNSNLCLRNMGVERKYNSETVSLREENSKKNIRVHKRKSNMEK